METKVPFKASSDNFPPSPKYRVINYQVTNKELGDAIQKALEDEDDPAATVYVAESPGREGWAIHFLFVSRSFGDPTDVKLVLYPPNTSDTNLVTQRGRVMTWKRLEVLLSQVQKWLGGNGEVALMFNWRKKHEGADE